MTRNGEIWISGGKKKGRRDQSKENCLWMKGGEEEFFGKANGLGKRLRLQGEEEMLRIFSASNFSSGERDIFEAGGKKNYLIFCQPPPPRTFWPAYVKRKQQSSSQIIFFWKTRKFPRRLNCVNLREKRKMSKFQVAYLVTCCLHFFSQQKNLISKRFFFFFFFFRSISSPCGDFFRKVSTATWIHLEKKRKEKKV